MPWTVAQPPASDYRIRVWYRDAGGNGVVMDESDAVFTDTVAVRVASYGPPARGGLDFASPCRRCDLGVAPAASQRPRCRERWPSPREGTSIAGGVRVGLVAACPSRTGALPPRSADSPEDARLASLAGPSRIPPRAGLRGECAAPSTSSASGPARVLHRRRRLRPAEHQHLPDVWGARPSCLICGRRPSHCARLHQPQLICREEASMDECFVARCEVPTDVVVTAGKVEAVKHPREPTIPKVAGNLVLEILGQIVQIAALQNLWASEDDGVACRPQTPLRHEASPDICHAKGAVDRQVKERPRDRPPPRALAVEGAPSTGFEGHRASLKEADVAANSEPPHCIHTRRAGCQALLHGRPSHDGRHQARGLQRRPTRRPHRVGSRAATRAPQYSSGRR